MEDDKAAIKVDGVTISYGDVVIQRDLFFSVKKNEIFVIMGGSGCGKTTVMRCMSGLKDPAEGRIMIHGVSLWDAEPDARTRITRNFGLVYQGGALWSSMTLAENIALPLEQYTRLGPAEIRQLASLKLSLVGLSGFEDYYPAEISGGMRKRAGVARALALDPEFLFFDEPSAGLDPVTSSRLDDLIIQLRDALGCTMVLVTHELSSIFAVADNALFLDAETKTMIAMGKPSELVKTVKDPKVYDFLTRGGRTVR